jgi:Ser/Thr protein kinase RdoA (MazF antagonist)
MSDKLTAELLSILGLRALAPLGGRQNRHWLVKSSSRSGAEEKVLRRWGPQPASSIEYERTLIVRIKAMGWPVAQLEEPVEFDGHLWSTSPVLPGDPKIVRDSSELRARGRLMAELHADTSGIKDLPQRPGWRRAEEILADQALDRILSETESTQPEEVRIVRWHLDRARLRIAGLNLADEPSIPIQGDFATWNLLFQNGQLSGLLDFELARNDNRVADFALAWRGTYDEVIEGYEEVFPLGPEQRLSVTPIWWAQLIESACQQMLQGTQDDGWTLKKLLARSPFMGPDALELP